jgi:hypothetical protein
MPAVPVFDTGRGVRADPLLMRTFVDIAVS